MKATDILTRVLLKHAARSESNEELLAQLKTLSGARHEKARELREDIYKQLAERGVVADTVLSDGFLANANDVIPLAPGTASSRAGAAVALNDATDKDSSFLLRHPNKSSLLASIVGAALGGAGGVLAGGGAKTFAGAAIGSASSLLLINLLRNRAVRRARENFNTHMRSGGKLTDKGPSSEYSTVDKILSPFSGTWRSGNAGARLALQDRAVANLGKGRVATDVAPLIGGAPLALGGQIGAHVGADEDERNLRYGLV